MGTLMDGEIKRWTARRKNALVLEIIQGKTTAAEASRAHDLPPSELEKWIEDARRDIENALRANPQDVREQYEKQLKDLQEAYGEANCVVKREPVCYDDDEMGSVCEEPKGRAPPPRCYAQCLFRKHRKTGA